MEILKIALLQMKGTGTEEGNLQKGIEFCKKAKQQGADIALFPEMWNIGYEIPEDVDRLKEMAVSAEGPFVSSYAELAKELDMAVGITFLEAHEPLPRNTICLFDRSGKLLYTYAKVHTCDFGDECRLNAGEDFYVAELDTAKGKIKVGSMICFDREFPESARILMLKGAELLLVPNACPMEINRLSQLRGRAYENMLAIATCNYPAGQPDCNGHSTVFDGVAYLPELPESRDTCILEAGEAEGVYIAELDVAQLRKYRESEVHGNAYRHPDKYGMLTEKKIAFPFIRKDYRE
ncbi:MAG: carbon-nitrogen hydrolase family protein [Lachnospiraceae bacterium]|nr:carbon-nitrogen hydrolase family protein [Lachnospiraceae bacterium]